MGAGEVYRLGPTAPSFNNRPGESELEIECADERTVNWLFNIVPKLEPFRKASLKLMRKMEWEASHKPKKMLPMSVSVPWKTTTKYFLDVLRAHNLFLQTKYWDVLWILKGLLTTRVSSASSEKSGNRRGEMDRKHAKE